MSWIGPVGRVRVRSWALSGHGCFAVDRVGCSVGADRAAAAAQGTPVSAPWTEANAGPAGAMRHPVRTAHRHVVGLPAASVGISGANLHDSQALIPLVKGIPPIRSRRGWRRRKPAKLHADKGDTTTPICGDGYASEASPTASPARESSPRNGWAAIAGPWNAPWPGPRAAAASTDATNAKLTTSSPSRASPAPSSAPADSLPDSSTCHRTHGFALRILDGQSRNELRKIGSSGRRLPRQEALVVVGYETTQVCLGRVITAELKGDLMRVTRHTQRSGQGIEPQSVLVGHLPPCLGGRSVRKHVHVVVVIEEDHGAYRCSHSWSMSQPPRQRRAVRP